MAQLKRFDLNLFLVFATIYESGSLTAASEKLHVTQPAVSNALAKLRTAFDDPLFVRSGRGVAPTPVARRMILPIRQALDVMNNSLEGRITFEPATSTRTFQLSASDANASLLLPGLYETVRREAPNANLQCFQFPRRDLADMMQAGELDVALDVPQLTAPALRKVNLADRDLVCAMRMDHPTAKEPWTLDTFLTLDHVTVSTQRFGQSLLDMTLGQQGVHITPKVRLQHYLPAIELVANTDLVTIVPRELCIHTDLILRSLPFEKPTTGVWLYWHQTSHNDPANEWLRTKIIDHFAGLYHRADHSVASSQ